MDFQQQQQQPAEQNVYLMNMFKEHLKLTSKIIIDDIYDNYWSYMKKYTTTAKNSVDSHVKDKYGRSNSSMKNYSASGADSQSRHKQVIDDFSSVGSKFPVFLTKQTRNENLSACNEEDSVTYQPEDIQSKNE